MNESPPPSDDMLQALFEVRRTMTGGLEHEQAPAEPGSKCAVPLGHAALQGNSAAWPPRTPDLPRWTRSLAHTMGDAYLERADAFLADLGQKERALFPGGELDAPRSRHVSRLIGATAHYAAALGIDIRERLFPATPDNIRFYSEDEYASIQRDFPSLLHTRGFNAAYTHFIGVKDVRSPAVGLSVAQHEILHRLGAKQYILVTNANGTIGVRCWRNGLGIGNNFNLVDEATVNDMTCDIRKSLWRDIGELSTYADILDPDIAENAILRRTRHKAGAIYRAFYDIMCDRASDVSGEDVKNQLRAAHFSGDTTYLRTLSKVFGNPAVTMLARYDIFSYSMSGVMDIATEMGINNDFMKRLYSYKDLATPVQRFVRLFK